MVCGKTEMEPYIQLISSHIDTDSKKFTDRIAYDGYEFSIIVSALNIEQTCSDLDYLFTAPKMSKCINIANMYTWEFSFHDDRGRKCGVSKLGEYIEFNIPYYRPIGTDVSSGIAYLRSFHDNVKQLLIEIHNPLNTAQITSDDD